MTLFRFINKISRQNNCCRVIPSNMKNEKECTLGFSLLLRQVMVGGCIEFQRNKIYL